MAGNSIGKIFVLTTFGESHGKSIGGIIDGCPAGIELDLNEIQAELDRRKPGQSNLTTQRKESDTVEFLSGIKDGVTLGTPIGFIIPNKDQRSKDYSKLEDVYRPSHADYTYDQKYGVRDVRGGGRSSARETACRVVAGAVAKQILKTKSISIQAFVKAIGGIEMDSMPKRVTKAQVENSLVRCPDEQCSEQMIEAIKKVKKEGDSLGGIVHCLIENSPTGLGEPVFEKLHANLGKAMLSINAVKGFQIGSGFEGTRLKGSEHNDEMVIVDGNPTTKTNRAGGVLGGISNGETIYFDVAFKPTATIYKKQATINTRSEEIEFSAEGRHDPCVVPRAVPIVEAMAAIVILDALLLKESNHI